VLGVDLLYSQVDSIC